jgi:hypothetical protein
VRNDQVKVEDVKAGWHVKREDDTWGLVSEVSKSHRGEVVISYVDNDKPTVTYDTVPITALSPASWVCHVEYELAAWRRLALPQS